MYSGIKSVGLLVVGLQPLSCGQAPEGGKVDYQVNDQEISHPTVSSPEEAGATGVLGPPEKEINGRHFIRADLLSEERLAELNDPDILEEPVTVDRMARRLRLFVQTPDGFYIQDELDMALARRALEAQAESATTSSGESVGPIQGRAIYDANLSDNGTSPPSKFDERYLGAKTTYPGSAVGFSEIGGSGTLVGSGYLYTAAHVLFETVTNKWICRDGNLSNSANPCDGVGEAGDARWIFNISGWNGCAMNIWYGGYWHAIESSDLTDLYKLASADFGAVQFLNCPQVLNNGSLGLISGSSGNGQAGGYPSYYYCPAGAKGAFNTTGDCPTSGGQGVWQHIGTSKPFSGGTLYWSSLAAYSAGNSPYQNSSWKFVGDWTSGMSGGPLLIWSSSTWYARGAVSASVGAANGLSVNVFNRYNATVDAFLESIGLP